MDRVIPGKPRVGVPRMFEDENESEEPVEKTLKPEDRVRETVDTLQSWNAEIVAVFEGVRKFEARLAPGLDSDAARAVQRGMAKLEKAKVTGQAFLPPASADEARGLLDYPRRHDLSTNDYHIHRRPGETMIVRWLAGEQVETFYQRLQANFDAAFTAVREDERQSQQWKGDPATLAYLDLLDKAEVKLADRYHRDLIRAHNLFALATQTADEMNIAHLCDYIMGIPAAEVVGSAAAPGDGATQKDRAWFYKLYMLRGMLEEQERMCFFAFLQKSDDSDW